MGAPTPSSCTPAEADSAPPFCGARGSLPLCVLARLLGAADAPLSLVSLLMERPWSRRRVAPGSGAPLAEVFEDGKWRPVPREERLRLAKADAQVALSGPRLLLGQPCPGLLPDGLLGYALRPPASARQPGALLRSRAGVAGADQYAVRPDLPVKVHH